RKRPRRQRLCRQPQTRHGQLRSTRAPYRPSTPLRPHSQRRPNRHDQRQSAAVNIERKVYPMLFLETKTLKYPVDVDARTRLLEELQHQGMTPLIRTTRLRFFEDALLSADRVTELETALASYNESTIDEPFVRGELFSFPDYILFLVFDRDKTSGDLLRAGIVYEPRTAEPFRKLDSFCEQVRNLLAEDQHDAPHWQSGKPAMPHGFRTFVERQDADSLYTSLRKETMSKRILAASKLEDERARVFLRTP